MGNGVLGLILAGGEGSRAGGADKGMLTWQGHTLAASVAAALRPCCQDIIISCNRNLADYQQITPHCFNDNVLNLKIPGDQASVQGPLAGIFTAWKLYPNQSFLVSPCDTPLISPLYAQRMCQGLDAQKMENPIRIAWDGERKQYLHCLVSPRAYPILKEYLQKGYRNVRGWLDSMEPELVDFSDQPELFTNINTLEQLHSL